MIANSQNQTVSLGAEVDNRLGATARVMGRVTGDLVSRGGFDRLNDFEMGDLPIVRFWRDV